MRNENTMTRKLGLDVYNYRNEIYYERILYLADYITIFRAKKENFLTLIT